MGLSGSSTIWMGGYEGRTWESIASALGAQGIRCVVDVRARPFSRRPGFSAGQLARGLAVLGVEYVSIPELGCTPDHRRELRKGGGAHGAAYRERLAQNVAALQQLVALARSRRVLTLCMERRPQQCHRAVLAERLAADGFHVVELLEPGPPR